MTQSLKAKIFDLFDGPTLSQLSTISRHGHPWVRYVMSTIDDHMILRIPTRSDTRKVAEIEHRPDVHVLVGKDLFSRNGAYAQMEGFAIISSDPRERARQWNPAMRKYFSDDNDPFYVLIEVRPCRIEYWSALEAVNPAVLDFDDLDKHRHEDEFWIAEGEEVPVFA